MIWHSVVWYDSVYTISQCSDKIRLLISSVVMKEDSGTR